MSRLCLSFLGTFQATRDEEPVTGFESGKVRALLAYLATQPQYPFTRSALAGLLWPEQAESSARANLRQSLSNLRRVLGDPDSETPFLLVSRESVQFNATADFSLDVATFRGLLDRCSRHSHRRAETCVPCSQWLAQAARLYRGPFLDGSFLQDSVELEEWVLLQRETLQRRALGALYRLAAYHERRGAYDAAYAFATRQIELDSWREEAHRQAMRVLVLRGERTAALAQYETCRRLLEEGLGVEPAEETVALYREILLAPGDTPLAPNQLALPSTHPHNLPPQPTPFIGREDELTLIAQLIEQQDYRLISLLGQGGAGKTRIALQAASEQIETFPDGVRYASLASVNSPAYLPSTIGAAVGLLFSGQKDERTQLLDELRNKEMLLVLDNLEHMAGLVDLLAAILAEAPGVTILATTRERLNLQGEQIVAVEGLPYPDIETEDPPESFPAVQLFVQSAKRLNPRFALTSTDEGELVRICRIVGGLPLAIELAAAWTPVLSCEEICREISEGLDFLVTESRDLPERHRSLRAVFDYSWSMLSGEERDLLCGLSVFIGGFSREAAELGAGATLRLLSSLVAKSLLHRSPMGRYEMHELLRQYAEGKLREAAEGYHEARDSHCRYYAGFVASREEKLRGKEQLLAREQIAADIDNLRMAWQWAVQQGRWGEIEKMAEGLWFFCEIGGLFQEADEVYRDAAAALSPFAAAEGDQARQGQEDAQRAILLGKMLARRGAILGLRMGHVEEGRDLLEKSISLLGRSGQRGETAFSLNILGSIERLLCRYERAKRCFGQSLEFFKEVGDRWGCAYSLSDLGNVEYLIGNYDEAKRLHEESLLISRQTGDRRAMMFCLNDSAGVAIALGEYEAATRSCRQALALSQELEHRWGEATARYRMGAIALYTGDYSGAETLLQESLAAFEALGDRQHAAGPLQHLGYLAYAGGEYTQARNLLHDTLEACREVGYPRGTAGALNGLGKVAHAEGESEKAKSYLQEALTIAVEIHAWPLVLDILVSTACISLAGSNDTEHTLSWTALFLARDHPATESHTKEQAVGLMAQYSEGKPDAAPSYIEPAAGLQAYLRDVSSGRSTTGNLHRQPS